ncbi:MAG: flagellar biosynthetic protein FliO [Bdellovibrionia bacterium]
MRLLAILLVSLGVNAAEANKNAQLSAEERISSMTDDEAAALLAEEFGPAKEPAPAEAPVQGSAQAAPAATDTEKSQIGEAKGNLAESQIPVLTETKKVREEAQPGPFRKTMLSLGIILAAILGTAFAARRWLSKKKASLPNAQIKIISQHYLGPRKSLAIVYVAGESLLVGITDNQINLVKQLSLIDDEIPGELPKKFDETLDFAENLQPEAGENFSMKGIKELVSTRLKNMREI